MSSSPDASAGAARYSMLWRLIACASCSALASVAITRGKRAASSTAACPLPVAQSHTISAFGDGTTFRVGYHFTHYDARGTEYTYDAHEILAGVRQLLPWRFAFEVFGSYTFQPYENASTFPDPSDLMFGQQYRLGSNDRHDEIGRVDVSLERPITDEVSVAARYSYINNDSNVDVFNYDRHLVGVYATLRFAPSGRRHRKRSSLPTPPRKSTKPNWPRAPKRRSATIRWPRWKARPTAPMPMLATTSTRTPRTANKPSRFA